MSKALFRFLRGEINGFYLTNIHNSLNVYSEDIKKFFIDFQAQQFELGKISDETLYNLGKFASVFLPRRPVAVSKASLYMTRSHKVDGVEFSERGLYNTENETFDFVHTDSSIETPDINTLATSTDRSSLVGDETAQGYISESETDVLDDEGNIKPSKVLPDAPSEGAYSEFYGNQFLILTDGNEMTYEDIAPSLYIELFKALQWIRYNGVSIASLVKIIAIVCPEGLVQIQRIAVNRGGNAIYVHYIYDSSSTVTNKESRLALLQYIVNIKFKQVILNEA